MSLKPKSYNEIIASLTDALKATTPQQQQQLQSGSVLQVESIASIMASVTFDINNLHPWPYMKYPPEYQKLLHFLAKLGVKIS